MAVQQKQACRSAESSERYQAGAVPLPPSFQSLSMYVHFLFLLAVPPSSFQTLRVFKYSKYLDTVLTIHLFNMIAEMVAGVQLSSLA